MKTINYSEIDNQLFELQKACNAYNNTDCLADWVLFAIHRYIVSNKVTKQFEMDFVNYPAEKFEMLIKACLNGDRSDNGILQTCREVFAMVRELSSIQSKIGTSRDPYSKNGFVFNGTWIVNPFYDETLRFEVDPVQYYGAENIKTFIKGAIS